MRKENLRKLAALAMAGVMLLSPLPVHAAEVDNEDAAQGSTSGSGNVEGIVNKDVFKVELPTVPDTNDTTFNFILDPQGLIKDTNGTAHANATFDAAAKGLYFANPQEGGATKYQASSPSLTAKNKGTLAVDVTLSAVASDLTDATNNTYSIGLSKDDTFSGDKSTSIYLALVSGSQTVALNASGATITDTLDAAPANAYEVTYDTTESKYKYGLTAAAQAASYTGFDSLDFNLTGACNTAADWTATESAAPSVNVTWALERHYVVPESDTSTPITINYKGADPAAGSLAFTKPDGTIWTPGASAYDTLISIKPANKSVVLTSDWLKIAKKTFGKGTYSVNINNKEYAFIIGDKAPVTDGTVSIVLTYTGEDPAAGSLTFTKPDGSTITPGESAYESYIVIDADSKTITLAADWLAIAKTTFGVGTYSVKINDKDYLYVIADQLPPPSTDGSTPITFTYTGDDPAVGSLTFTKPDGSTITPGESAYESYIKIDSDSKTITLAAEWLNIAKTNFGVGTYSINGTDFTFEIE